MCNFACFVTHTKLFEAMFYVLLAVIVVALFVFRKRADFSAKIVFPLILLFGTLLAIFFSPTAEDAFITYRYAENLANGFGPVWNIGERVQGYSNFLWMVLLAFTNAITHIAIPILGKLFSYLFYVLSLLTIYRITQKLKLDSLIQLLVILVVASFSGIATYAISGMESSLFIFLILSFSLALLENAFLLAACISVLLALCRPEGMLVLPVLGIAMLVNGELISRKLKSVVTLVIPVVGIGSYYLFVHSYYGYFIPNSVAAKKIVSIVEAIRVGKLDLSEFLTATKISVFTAFLAVLFVLSLVQRKAYDFKKADAWKGLMIFSMTIGIFAIFYVRAGGDWMPSWRYLTHVYPILIISLAVIGSLVTVGRSRVALALGLAAMCFWNLHIAFDHSQGLVRVREWSGGGEAFELLGKSLHETFPTPVITIASQGAGGLPFYAKLPVIDELGLNDEHIARHGKRTPLYGQRIQGHLAHDYAYVMSRKPDLIMNGMGDKGVATTDYCFVQLHDNKYGISYRVYARKDRWQFIESYFKRRSTAEFSYHIIPFKADWID